MIKTAVATLVVLAVLGMEPRTMHSERLAGPALTLASDPDTVIVRMTSTRGKEVTFSALIVADTIGRPLRRVQTPYELRIATTTLHVLLRVEGGDEIDAEITALSGGKRLGHGRASGNTLMLFAGRGGELGVAGM